MMVWMEMKLSIPISQLIELDDLRCSKSTAAFAVFVLNTIRVFSTKIVQIK